MKVVVFTQDIFGGTDRIFENFLSWSKGRSDVEVYVFRSDEDLLDVDLIILPTSEMQAVWKKRKLIPNDCRINVWAMGQDAIHSAFYNTKYRSLYNFMFIGMFRLFRFFSRKKEIFSFTDEVAYNYFYGSKKVCNEKFIYPIPINGHLEGKVRNNKSKRFYWLGRLDRDFKIWSLLELLQRLSFIDFDFSFHIIGDGDGKDLLNNSYNFDVIFHGSLPHSKMEEHLKENADLLFAMGTSGLEGAKLSIPTIIVSPLKEGQINSTYRWIYQSKGLSMGEFNDINVKPRQISMNLHEAIRELVKDPERVSKKSYHYSLRFNRDIVFSDLMRDANKYDFFCDAKNTFFLHYLTVKIKSYVKKIIN